ncbi:MAG TPA: hypothetical protein VK178_04085 [Opitutaceae bacterium]|nr:hypothetical protein [Opitutaceae bacterium]
MTTPRSRLGRRQWWQIAALTAAALAAFWLVRRLPTGTNLGHMDFRVAGGNGIELCDPANPQFLPVVDVPSPVRMTLAPADAEPGRVQAFVLTLRTASGKPIGPDDLAVAHTRKLHLLVVDPSLEEYHHVHPEPGGRAGEWRFELTPNCGGVHRVFADFVPVATGRGLYAAAAFTVTGAAGAPVLQEASRCERDGLRFALTASKLELRAREVTELRLAIEAPDGGPVTLEPVMGAFAHLVAFDQARRGFAHLHPNETDLAKPPDPWRPELSFRVTLPEPGLYVVWAQVDVAGREVFAPFTIAVR